MLKNKVALVTGASSGIGRAIALVWAREGAKVVVSDVNVQAGEETAALVRAAGGDAIFVAADVGKPEDCDALVQRTVGKHTIGTPFAGRDAGGLRRADCGDTGKGVAAGFAQGAFLQWVARPGDAR